MLRTPTEVYAEIKRLSNLQHQVPDTNVFGDDNESAIRAQIEVLQELLTLDQIEERFEDDGDYIHSAAMNAENWLREQDERPPSETWELLAQDEPDLYKALALA